MKKLLLTLLAAFLALSATAQDFSYTGADGVTLTYTVLDAAAKTCAVKASPTTLTKVEIPATVEFEGVIYTVTSIGDAAFYGRTQLGSIKIPSTVKSLGYRAFRECVFTSIDIPSSVETIGDAAFEKTGTDFCGASQLSYYARQICVQKLSEPKVCNPGQPNSYD